MNQSKLADLPKNVNFPKMEESILRFWQDNDTFQKSVEQRPVDKQYVFYDGPPFATGMPHFGHLLGSTSKDVIPRYWTMKGYRVERVWGWDTHGLPIENMIENSLKINGGKKGIEELGIDKFNEACRQEVLRLDKEWEKVIHRLGRWVDFTNNYKTMDINYMESVWWGFKQLFEKGLIYQGRKVVLYCPRCATPLSNFEIAMDNSYQDVEDPAVVVKFPVVKDNQVSDQEYFLAWTTTPWTLPGNVGLAVHPDSNYSLVQVENEKYWLASDLVKTVLGKKTYTIVATSNGAELVGKKYQPPFDYVQSNKSKAWTILAGDFVSLEEGTGIVHTAALFGEDDYGLALKADLPLVPTIDDDGKFLPFVKLVAGKFYKAADPIIVQNLTSRHLLFKSEQITHSYPFCYRCGTPLFYNAVPAWFINVQKLKKKLLAENEKMNWFPAHLKHGRFGKGLITAPDWNISRSRYWGTPMPIWTAEVDDQTVYRVIGSIEELKTWAVNPNQVANLTDLHRHYVDQIEIWIDDQKTVKGHRIPEVFDCWVESGAMPFASRHYPFENKEKFEDTYPAQFVSEYIAQTRAWFYTMHVMSVGIFNQHAVENTLTTGTIMAHDGTKMSKSKKNFTDPMQIINQYGADSLRLYLMSSPVMRSENINFNDSEVNEIRKRVLQIWWNCVVFYRLYAGDLSVNLDQLPQPATVMDRWILSRINSLIQTVTTAMDAYDVVTASRSMIEFVNELSTWYLRRSREQIKIGQHKDRSLHVFGLVNYQLAQLFAPMIPFFTENVYHSLVDQNNSIHLTKWPEVSQHLIDENLETEMTVLRKVVELVLAKRAEVAIKIRQPLPAVTIFSPHPQPRQELIQVLQEEVNVKTVVWKNSAQGDQSLTVKLDTTLSPALLAEGDARELIRNIQKLRKQSGLTVGDQAIILVAKIPRGWQGEIESKTNSTLNIDKTLPDNLPQLNIKK